MLIDSVEEELTWRRTTSDFGIIIGSVMACSYADCVALMANDYDSVPGTIDRYADAWVQPIIKPF